MPKNLGKTGGVVADEIPPIGHDGLRHWQVAGGVIMDGGQLLLVENQRRNGSTDWTTPGGVVDPGESALEGLTREVEEETGIVVEQWKGPLYRVEVIAPDAGFFLKVEAHRAERYSGEIRIDDPDGIVVSAEFIEVASAATRLEGGSPWVVEPLLAYVLDGVDDGRLFEFKVEGGHGEERRVTRLHQDQATD